MFYIVYPAGLYRASSAWYAAAFLIRSRFSSSFIPAPPPSFPSLPSSFPRFFPLFFLPFFPPGQLLYEFRRLYAPTHGYIGLMLMYMHSNMLGHGHIINDTLFPRLIFSFFFSFSFCSAKDLENYSYIVCRRPVVAPATNIIYRVYQRVLT